MTKASIFLSSSVSGFSEVKQLLEDGFKIKYLMNIIAINSSTDPPPAAAINKKVKVLL